MDTINKLESEHFNLSTTEKLASHPVISAAESGTLNVECIKRFVLEQYYVIKSDTASLEAGLNLHGKTSAAYKEFFEVFLSGEKFLKEIHLKMADALHISEKELDNYQPSHLCQAYPSKFCQLVHQSDPSIVAIAFAVNFPAWGQMCGRFKAALLANYKDQLGLTEDNLGFLSYCAEPTEWLPSLVDKVASASKSLSKYDFEISYKEIKDAVRLLQEYEVLFWDGVFEMQ